VNKEEFNQYLSKKLPWSTVINMLNNIPHYLNERERLFDKAKIIQKSIDHYSNGKLNFVGEVGFDFYIKDKSSKFNNLKVELKSGRNIFTVKNKHNLKKITSKTNNITLNNSNGSSFNKEYQKTYDYLLLVDISGFAVTTWEEVYPHAQNCGSGFKANLPLDILSIKQYVNSDNVKKLTKEVPDFFDEAAYKMIKYIEENA
jgi:hypothetical protein